MTTGRRLWEAPGDGYLQEAAGGARETKGGAGILTQSPPELRLKWGRPTGTGTWGQSGKDGRGHGEDSAPASGLPCWFPRSDPPRSRWAQREDRRRSGPAPAAPSSVERQRGTRDPLSERQTDGRRRAGVIRRATTDPSDLQHRPLPGPSRPAGWPVSSPAAGLPVDSYWVIPPPRSPLTAATVRAVSENKLKCARS